MYNLLILGVFLFMIHVYYWFNNPSDSQFIKDLKTKYNTKEDFDKLESEELFKVVVKALSLLIIMLAFLIGYVFFLAIALGIDILLYPTVIMILWFVAGIGVSSKQAKKNKSKDIEPKKPNQFIRNIKYIITLTYIGYIIYLLVA